LSADPHRPAAESPADSAAVLHNIVNGGEAHLPPSDTCNASVDLAGAAPAFRRIQAYIGRGRIGDGELRVSAATVSLLVWNIIYHFLLTSHGLSLQMLSCTFSTKLNECRLARWKLFQSKLLKEKHHHKEVQVRDILSHPCEYHPTSVTAALAYSSAHTLQQFACHPTETSWQAGQHVVQVGV
jgi:hypothetical protein